MNFTHCEMGQTYEMVGMSSTLTNDMPPKKCHISSKKGLKTNNTNFTRG
jgi:hypothetical protein